jgi:DNA polymerase-3 subunit delta'
MLEFLARHNPPWRAHELLDQVREARAAGVYNVNPELEASRLLLAWQALMPRRRAG